MNKIVVIGIVGNSVFMPVERFHTGGETIEAETTRFEYGGKGFNQAVAAARQGAEVCFISAVGKDGYEGIKGFLEKEKIESILVKKEEPTAFAAIITDKTGANRVTVYQGAQLSAQDSTLFDEKIKSADVLLLNNEVKEEINLIAAEIAQKYGVKIILNPAPYRETQKEMLDKVFVFTPNEHEGMGLEKYSNVVQTLGGKGCYIKATDTFIPAERVKAVDTTGAGDTFNGVFAFGIANDCGIIESAILASKAAGISVTRNGAVSSIPYKNEIN